MSTETIDHNTLARLIEAGAVRATHVVGKTGGWGVIIQYGKAERSLAATRSRQERLFKRLETVVAYLKDLGISHFDVDAASYDPASIKTYSRPDRSVAMKRAHDAAACSGGPSNRQPRGAPLPSSNDGLMSRMRPDSPDIVPPVQRPTVVYM